MSVRNENPSEPSKISGSNIQSGRSIKGYSVSGPEVTNSEKELAQKVLFEFLKGNYQQCTSILNTLVSSRTKDCKVLYNKAVCEYFLNGLSKTEAFKKNLHEITSKKSSFGNKTEEPGKCDMAWLSLAVVYYHERQFEKAIKLLQVKYSSLDHLEEKIGINMGLLLAKCYLLSDKPWDALELLKHMGTTFLPQPLGSHGSVVSSSPVHTPTHQLREPMLEGSHFSASYASGPEGGPEDSQSSSPQESLRRSLLLLRTRAFILCRKLKPANREFKAVIYQAASANQQLELILVSMKSQLKFMGGKYLKSLKVLNNCASIVHSPLPPIRQQWPSLQVWYNNNLSLIHLGLKKPALATLYCEKAVKQYDEDYKQADNINLYDNNDYLRTALLYNMAVVYLRCSSSPQAIRRAFQIFFELRRIHRLNSRLWLHLAQCCVVLHKMKVRENSPQPRLIKIGPGNSSKVFLESHPCTSSFKVKASSNADTCKASSNADTCKADSLPFGQFCARTALQLLPSCAPPDDTENEEVYSMPPSLAIRADEVERLRCSILAHCAYINLCLASYDNALSDARQLLAVTSAANSLQLKYKYLANLYCAESLVLLNRCNDALKYLDIAELQESTTFPCSNEEVTETDICSPCCEVPERIIERKKIMLYNLCVTHCHKNNYVKALNLLDKVLNMHTGAKSASLFIIQLYLSIKLGLQDKVGDLIEEHLESRFSIK